jgi:hypothetical protein
MSNYSELKKAAEAATPGPWRYWGEVGHEIFGPVHGGSGSRCFRLNNDARMADAEFIAAANPEVVLSLISDNHAAQSQLAALREELANETERANMNALKARHAKQDLNSIQKRLADAERRNFVMYKALSAIRVESDDVDSCQCAADALADAALKPSESGASE